MAVSEVSDAKASSARPRACRAGSVGYPVGQSDVQLDHVWLEIEDVAKTGEAGAGVVNGQSEPIRSEVSNASFEPRIVSNRCVLGQFEHDPLSGNIRQHRPEVVRRDGLDGCID